MRTARRASRRPRRHAAPPPRARRSSSFLFFHEKYQPELTVDLGSTSADIRLSDLAVLVVVIAAAVYAVRTGTSRLGSGSDPVDPGLALLVWLAFQALRPASVDDARFEDHLVSYVKLVEYALLAVAVPLLVRRTQDLTIVLGSLVLWSAVASAVALAQFFGLDVFDAWNAGWRQPSFLGHHDLAALSAISAALAVPESSLAERAFRPRRSGARRSSRARSGSCSPARSPRRAGSPWAGSSSRSARAAASNPRPASSSRSSHSWSSSQAE